MVEKSTISISMDSLCASGVVVAVIVVVVAALLLLALLTLGLGLGLGLGPIETFAYGAEFNVIKTAVGEVMDDRYILNCLTFILSGDKMCFSSFYSMTNNNYSKFYL